MKETGENQTNFEPARLTHTLAKSLGLKQAGEYANRMQMNFNQASQKFSGCVSLGSSCFSTEGPGELALRAGDVVTAVEQVDTEWYRGTCRGSTGFFPISYAKILVNSMNN